MSDKVRANSIIDYIAIIILPFISVLITKKAGFFMLAFCGCSIILYTIHTWAMDSKVKHYSLLALEILLTCAAGFVAGHLVFFTMLMFLPRVKNLTGRIAMTCTTAVVYLGYCVFSNTVVINDSSEVDISIKRMNKIGVTEISQMLLLMLICFMIVLIKEYIIRMENRMMKNSDLIRKAAVNEMNFRKLNEELEARNFMAERNARMEEREKIARNIHNAVGHTITSAIVALDASETLYEVNPERAREKMQVAESRMKLSLEEIRRAVRVLDSGAREVMLQDFISMLEMEINQFVMDTERKVRHNLKDAFPEIALLAEHAEFLHGAVAESLSNGIRHGKATIFILLLECDRSHIKISVSDNGKNEALTGSGTEETEFSESYPQMYSNGFGLKKMDEYLKKCGGSMKVKCGEGFTVIMQIPL